MLRCSPPWISGTFPWQRARDEAFRPRRPPSSVDFFGMLSLLKSVSTATRFLVCDRNKVIYKTNLSWLQEGLDAGVISEEKWWKNKQKKSLKYGLLLLFIFFGFYEPH